MQRRLPFSTIEPLVSFVQEIATSCDPNLLEQYSCSRKKVVKVTNKISTSLKGELFEQLRTSPFSLSVDESSDVYGQSYLAICVRFLEGSDYNKLSTKLISILPRTDSSVGEVLYNKVKREILVDPKIELNFMGLVTDEGPNMAGKYSGLSARMVKDYPYIVEALDFSHLYNNIFKKSLKGFPDDVIDIITGISKHFAYSTQKRAQLKELQTKAGTPHLGVLHYIETRWLSMGDSLERILEIWNDLQAYFEEFGSQKEKNFFSEKNQTYLKVLYSLTYKLNACNQYFQRDNIFYDSVVEKIQSSFVIFVNMIVKSDSRNQKCESHLALPFEKMSNKDIKAGKFHLEIQSFLGDDQELQDQLLGSQSEAVQRLFEGCEPNAKKGILLAARKFILFSLKYMKKKLPYQNQIINDTKVIFLKEFDREKWIRLQSRFTNIISSEKMRNAFGNELDSLQYHFEDISSVVKMRKISPLETWKNLEEDYPTLCTLARALMTLPCSTVAVERAFSSLKNIKNAKRNRLTIHNLEACLLTYQNIEKKPNLGNQSIKKTSTPKISKNSIEDQVIQSQNNEEPQTQIKSQEISFIKSEENQEDNDESLLASVEFIPSQSNFLKRVFYQKNSKGEKKVFLD